MERLHMEKRHSWEKVKGYLVGYVIQNECYQLRSCPEIRKVVPIDTIVNIQIAILNKELVGLT